MNVSWIASSFISLLKFLLGSKLASRIHVVSQGITPAEKTSILGEDTANMLPHGMGVNDDDESKPPPPFDMDTFLNAMEQMDV